MTTAAPDGQMGRLAVRFLPETFTAPPAEQPVIVEGFMRRGEKVVIAAPRGIGKSWTAMELALRLGRGEGRFLGHLPVRRPARVLLCQGELDAWATWGRWKKLVGAGGPPDRVAECFEPWRIRIARRRCSRRVKDDSGSGTESHDWVDAVLDDRLEEIIASHGFEVLILDPWRTYFAGDENNNTEVEAALARLDDLIRGHGIAVVALHHLSKARDGAEVEDTWRGASRLADWASTRVTLLPHFTDSQAKRQGMTRAQARRFVDVHFLRRHEPTENFSVQFDPELGLWVPWNSPEKAAEARRKDLDPEDVAEVCATAGGFDSLRKAAVHLKVSAAVARRALDRAVVEGLVEEIPGPRGSMAYRAATVIDLWQQLKGSP